MDKKTVVSLIILSWNGRHLLERHLASLYRAVDNSPLPCEIIVVDNGSNDSTAEYIRKEHNRVKLVKLDKNARFTGGNNAGANVASGDILVFLNNDVEVEPDFLKPLLRHFNDPDVFAVGCNILMKGVRKESGLTKGCFKRGFLQVEHSWEEYDKEVPILYASGAAFACDRKKFMELGGFDTLWDPFYWEDTDLCYRAWKRGWRVLFEPKSVVWHMHQATNNPGNFSKLFLDLPKEANKYLFVWKNIAQPRYLFYHLSLLPLALLSRIFKFQLTRILAFLVALIKLPRAIYSGAMDERFRKLNDAEILKRTNDSLYYKKCYRESEKPRERKRLKILYICAYLPVTGVSAGSGRMFEIIKRLSGKHQVDLVSFIIDEELKYLPAVKETCNRVDVVKRNYAWHRDSFSVLPSMIDEFYSKDMESLIKKRLYEEDYDIVQFEYLHMSQYVPKVYPGKLILTEHQLHYLSRRRDFLSLRPGIKKLEAFVSYLKGMVYEVKTCAKFDKVITMTPHEKEILESFYCGISAECVPMGVDTGVFSPDSRSGKESSDIIYLGFFRHYPNVDAIMYFTRHIYPLIKRQYPHVRFNILGFDPPKDIIDMGNRDGIKVIGYAEDIRPFLEGAKVFIMPIRLGMGMRGKLFEAWAMEKAVVSTSIGCEGVDVKHGVDIMVADTPEDFAAKTVELIKNDNLRNAMGKRAREKAVSKYDWGILTEKIEAIYGERL